MYSIAPITVPVLGLPQLLTSHPPLILSLPSHPIPSHPIQPPSILIPNSPHPPTPLYTTPLFFLLRPRRVWWKLLQSTPFRFFDFRLFLLWRESGRGDVLGGGRGGKRMGRKRLSGSEMLTFEHWKGGGGVRPYPMYLQYMPHCWKSRDFEVGFFLGWQLGLSRLVRRSVDLAAMFLNWGEEVVLWAGGMRRVCMSGEGGRHVRVRRFWGKEMWREGCGVCCFLFEIWRVWLGWRVRDLGVVVSCGLCQQ